MGISPGLQRDLNIEAAVAKAGGPCPSCGHAWGQHGTGGCGRKNGHDIYCSCPTEPPAMVLYKRNELRQKIFSKPCPDHKRYHVINPPRVNCEACWRMWIKLNP